MTTLNVYSIFTSFSGEAGIIQQGAPTVFLRLAGCNLRCSYCDTAKSQDPASGHPLPVEEVIKSVNKQPHLPLLITGGEPLLQQAALMNFLAHEELGRRLIQIETNGSILPSRDLTAGVDGFVMDYKLPSSGQTPSMLSVREIAECIEYASNSHFVTKFVCSNSLDFSHAISVMEEIKEQNMDNVAGSDMDFAFSPCHPHLSAEDLGNWILKTGLADVEGVLLSLQIHKYIFPQGEKGDKA